MKKILIAGIIIFLIMFAVTCEAELPEDEVEYTDVVYSEDLSQVTLYLDGVGVPITKAERAAQRAMSTRLSKMAYDYLEVIFYYDASNVARAQWELGQTAGISGVYRGVAPTGVNYAYNSATTPALMAVGKKDGKTLLGVGRIANVDNAPVTPDTDGYPATQISTITPDTKSVTFYIEAVKTGLLCGYVTGTTPESVHADGDPTGTKNKYDIKFDSLKFTLPAGNTIKDGSKRTTLAGADYPLYAIPTTGGAVYEAEYTFDGAAKTYVNQLKFYRTGSVKAADVEMRMPRYMDGGRYWQPKSSVDMRTTVELGGTGNTYPLTAEATKNVVPLTITRKGTGIFSFYIDIPVIALDKATGTNDGKLSPVIWHIRTGLGSELYSLDDGLTSGGCVLMGVGVNSLDWLDIEWEWVP